ncbi:MAG: hypothetical protein JM58_07665 [Peptococcaceae bacterium BICA1-8]|nr:MAG: hypothetical protein JM58_07665 [Peptococcaceae bacterium BICA1-8]
MGIMPHTDVNEAIKLALSLDIPFWPQLPRVSFYEDMYVQISENFPGIIVNEKEMRVEWGQDKFYQELDNYALNMENDQFYTLSPAYSKVYNKFLQQDLTNYEMIRGQTIGPISFGLQIKDEHKKPIIYNDDIREMFFDFIAKKIQIQYRELTTKNKNAFVWIDEPGLEMLFMSFTGYTSERAKLDLSNFLSKLPGPKGVHLCGNPDWSFLLTLGLDILSIDVLLWGHIFTRYIDQLKEYLARGGIISWGIVPTTTGELQEENILTLVNKIEEMWDYLVSKGLTKKQLARQSWFAPARCCLINQDGHETVEKSFTLLTEVAKAIKERHL